MQWTNGISGTSPLASTARENEFVMTRDLHEWEMDLTIDQQEGPWLNILCSFPSKSISGYEVEFD